MNLEIVEAKLFAGVVADEIAQVLGEAIEERGSATLVLAGGSTPASVYRALAVPPRIESVQWEKVRVYLGDERWVPPNDALSNFRMASETLLHNVQARGDSSRGFRVFPVDTSLAGSNQGSPKSSARSYEDVIRTNEGSGGRDSFPEFDLVLLGMGDDGHTASLFPGARVEAGPLVGVVEHPTEAHKPGGTRITMTADLLTHARRMFFLVTGEGKASMLKQVLEEEGSEAQYPARLFKRAKGAVTFFVDTGAATLLSRSAGTAS